MPDSPERQFRNVREERVMFVEPSSITLPLTVVVFRCEIVTLLRVTFWVLALTRMRGEESG